jgi:transposase
MPRPVKVSVLLTEEQRAGLEEICRRQSVGAARQRKARILLLSDENCPDGGHTDEEIAEIVGLCERQVVRIRQRYVREGDPTLDRKQRAPGPRKLDGKAEAHLVVLCCSDPPAGRDHWTLELLCDELKRLRLVESVCRETVRKSLKKTSLNHGGRSGSVSPRSIGRGSWPAWKKSSTFTKSPTMTSGC